MSQEDNACDCTAAQAMFNIRMRDFEAELNAYEDLIR
jgi:hypothetical protein